MEKVSKGYNFNYKFLYRKLMQLYTSKQTRKIDNLAIKQKDMKSWLKHSDSVGLQWEFFAQNIEN